MKLPEPDWFADEEYWRSNRQYIWSEKRIEMSADAAASISELLEIEPGETVLDLACGFGRYSIPLAKLGYAVTGVDLNRDFIREASEKARELDLEAHFECADMREYSKPEFFGRMIIMYNSFGYFQNPADDRKVVENCYRSLKPGGRLMLHGAARELIAAGRRNRLTRYWFEDAEGTLRLEESFANDDWTWSTTRWILIRGAERREYTYGMRLYSTDEYIDLFTSAGFLNPQTYGSVSGRPYDREKDHLVLVVEKPGSPGERKHS